MGVLQQLRFMAYGGNNLQGICPHCSKRVKGHGRAELDERFTKHMRSCPQKAKAVAAEIKKLAEGANADSSS